MLLDYVHASSFSKGCYIGMCHLSLSGRKSTDILSAEINTKLNQHEIITDWGEIEEVSEGGLSLQNYLSPYLLLYIQMLLMRKMPQGLQVNVNCHALLHNITDVDSKFNQTKAHAETDFVQHLIEHCTKIRGILITDIQTIEKGIQNCERHGWRLRNKPTQGTSKQN